MHVLRRGRTCPLLPSSILQNLLRQTSPSCFVLELVDSTVPYRPKLYIFWNSIYILFEIFVSRVSIFHRMGKKLLVLCLAFKDLRISVMFSTFD